MQSMGLTYQSARHCDTDTKAYIKPTFHQGQYNALCRRSETELFPTLHKYHMVYSAYSALAGSFLTGLPTSANQGTRFESGNKMGTTHTLWYDEPVMHTAIKTLKEGLDLKGLSSSEMSIRWLTYHSLLEEGDGIIIEGSKFF